MTTRITLALVLLLAGAGAASAQKTESLYTTLDQKACKTIEFEAEGASSTQLCPGVAGYKLHVLTGDDRQSITVIQPGGAEHPLELWHTISGAFSTVGPRAEWRVRRRGGKIEPFALIFRFSANSQPDDPVKVNSYLVVARLTPGRVCVTDRIEPGPKANELARLAADASAGKPCRAGGEEAGP